MFLLYIILYHLISDSCWMALTHGPIEVCRFFHAILRRIFCPSGCGRSSQLKRLMKATEISLRRLDGNFEAIYGCKCELIQSLLIQKPKRPPQILNTVIYFYH